ncbi:hypothetical protein [Verrucosispora sioxanthis]|uniref:Uncharacterized protein n=1 Tax=Verrucosispora sioxanthis TaxID=2499994 RepID=A0A6M1L556_9ACTN|nr:hypothetical protein [Verrucosispora sioxanthis]NEE64760.1 hypothetical protein [Verrucosispora sioxanthis]NGM13870.1 hypothetical protein [Verrucosispora sioxanthis]
MTTAWTVDAVGAHLTLDQAGHGEIVFTVSNPGVTPDTAVLRLAPDDGVSPSWFTVDRPQRAVPANSTVSYLVTVNVPAEVPAGRYEVRASVSSADSPPEESSRFSGRVVVEVRRPAERPRRRRWLLATVGAAVLAVALLAVGVSLFRPGRVPAAAQPVSPPATSPATPSVSPSTSVVVTLNMEALVDEPATTVTVGGAPARPACDGRACELWVTNDCCHYGYTEGYALGFFARPYDSFTVTVTVAEGGDYELFDVRLLGPNAGRTMYLVDDRPVGEFAESAARYRLTGWTSHGTVRLTAGAHRLTLRHLPLSAGDGRLAITVIDQLRLVRTGS